MPFPKFSITDRNGHRGHTGIVRGKSPALGRHSINTASPTVLMGFSGFSAQCLLSLCFYQDGLAEVVDLPKCFLLVLCLLLLLKELC